MIFLMTVWFPPNKAIDAAKLYLEQPREIPHIRKWQAFNTSGGMDGHKQYHLIMTERGKGDEGIQSITKYMMPLIEIEGLRYRVEVLMGITDSYKTIGMDWE
ncbi:MAG: hypothetical protein ACXAC8_09095 [Candidatus Hodarchaeales archaeon]|jgi:hypothetical protein